MSELEAWKEAHASLKTQLDELRSKRACIRDSAKFTANSPTTPDEETHLRSMVEAGEQQMLQQKAHIAELESNLVMVGRQVYQSCLSH